MREPPRVAAASFLLRGDARDDDTFCGLQIPILDTNIDGEKVEKKIALHHYSPDQIDFFSQFMLTLARII